MMKKRIIYLLLLAVMLLSVSALTSCGGGDTSQKAPYNADYDGYRFVIGWSNADGMNEVDYSADEVGEGEVLQAAIQKRNQKVEEKLNVQIEDLNTGSNDIALKMISETVMAGEQLCDVYSGAVSTLYQASLLGYCEDLNSVSSFDFSHDWWDEGLVSDYALGSSRLYYVSGDITVMDDLSASCLFFNRSLFFSNRMDYPYEMVTNGEWTYEAFSALLKGLSRDLNSNGEWDIYDRYGFVTDSDELVSLLGGFGTTVLKAADGVITLNEDESVTEQATALLNALYRTEQYDMIFSGGITAEATELFHKGQAFFTSGKISDVFTYREVSQNQFGILPYPKYDADQKNYSAVIDNDTATALSILRYSADPNRTGNILEHLGSESEEVVSSIGSYLPFHDEESKAMLSYITGSKHFTPMSENDASYDAILAITADKEMDYHTMVEQYGSTVTNTYLDATEYYNENSKNEIKEIVDVISSDYVISFWNYKNACDTTKEDVKQWAEAGITLAASPRFNYDRDDVSHMLMLLDECEKYGLKVIIQVDQVHYYQVVNEEAYRANFTKAYADFGSHPAVYAFWFGDEPNSPELFAQVEKSAMIMKELAPEVTLFMNFWPYTTGCEEYLFDGKNFQIEMKKLIENCQLDFIGYDVYCQMLHGDDSSKYEGYYKSMHAYSELARKTGTEWWNSILCSGHMNYKDPTANDLLWQLTTSAAHGAKGIMWYLWYGRLDYGYEYHNSPINEFGETTATYDNMSYVHKMFHAQYGQLLSELTFKQVYHFNTAYGGYSLFPKNSHDFILRMESQKNTPGVISFFEDDQGQEYVVVLNNSQVTTAQFTMVLKNTTSRVLAVRQNGDVLVDKLGSAVKDGNELKLSFYLTPGQMNIYRIS